MIQASGPIIWNNIPDHIQNAGTLFTFKKHLKKHFIEQYDIDNDNDGDNSDNDDDNDNHDNNVNNVNNNNDNNNRNNNNNNNNRNNNGNFQFRRPFVSRWDGGTA